VYPTSPSLFTIAIKVAIPIPAGSPKQPPSSALRRPAAAAAFLKPGLLQFVLFGGINRKILYLAASENTERQGFS
jgi:hypothetical protein